MPIRWDRGTIVFVVLMVLAPGHAVAARADTSPDALTASITYPDEGQVVSGLQTVGMSTTVPWDLPKMFTLFVDGFPIVADAMATGSTLWIAWDSRAVANGPHTLSLAVTVDGETLTDTRTVTVDNDPPPTAAILYPTEGQTVSGAQTVGMSTTARWDLPKTFTLSVDGVPIVTHTIRKGSTSWITWDTSTVTDGARTLELAVTIDQPARPGNATRTATRDTRKRAAETGMAAATTPDGPGATLIATRSVAVANEPVAEVPTPTPPPTSPPVVVPPDPPSPPPVVTPSDPPSPPVVTPPDPPSPPVVTPRDPPSPPPVATPPDPPTSPPAPPPPVLTAAFTSPTESAVVTETTPIGMIARGATGPFTFTLSTTRSANVWTHTTTGATASHDWDTTSVPDGAHTLTLTVTNGDGAQATASRTVMVSNAAAVPPTARAMGPLRVLASNPRYFTDGTGRAIYLTGSHHWESLVDLGAANPPVPFDYPGYLDFIGARGHNFFRMWAWEASRHGERAGATSFNGPSAWMRTGPGTALDGKPKWDLTKLDPAYFARLRARVIDARERGMYAGVMLFEGWQLQFSSALVHPFDVRNNVNGIDGDVNGDGKLTETHTLAVPAITEVQKAYVRRMIDTVNDLDNVLYEIANESGPYSTAWQYAMIETIRQYQARKPQQHPIGMTFQYRGGSNATLLSSPADWISPGETDPYRTDPPAATGRKVIVSDTDHLGGSNSGLGRAWVWKSFTRGLHTIYMDPLDSNATREDARKAMGHTLDYANRMNLAAMTPQPALCSTRYCLAGASGENAEMLAYLPSGGTATVNLAAASGTLGVEWFNPATGTVVRGGTTDGGATRSFTAPFGGDAVLYIGNR
jgi:hypothetical protein